MTWCQVMDKGLDGKECLGNEISRPENKKNGAQDCNMMPFLESCYHTTSKHLGVLVNRRWGYT